MIDADFIAVFDADHVPASTFLEKTLGYFTDERVALVQTPQDFYNLDSFVHADDDASNAALDDQHFHEEALFYRVIQPGKNRWDGAFWCGTNAVLRVAALREVGGVATGSVTEDIHTTIRLHRRGWKSVYHNEVLARGLAAATAAQFQLQRHRWGLGAMQVIRQENPIFRRGLSLRQRISYLATLWAWFDAWRTLAYLLLPAAVLFSGVSPIQASAATFLWAFGASFLVQQLAMVALGRGYHRPFSSAIFDLVRMTPNLMATLTVIWPREIGFHVTPKGRTGEVRVKGPVSGVLIAALALQLISAVWFGLTFAGLTPTTYHTPWSAYGAVFWLAVNTVLLLVTIRRVRAIRFAGDLRRAVRFEVGLDALFGQGVCRVLDMSVTGARLALPRGPVQVSEAEPLSFVVRGRPVDLRVRQVGQMHMDGQQQIMHVDYVEGQLSARATLALALFRPEGEPQRQDRVPEFTLEVPSLVDAELHAAIAEAAATLNGADYDTRGGEPPRA